MHIKTLKLKNFRSYENQAFEFDSKTTLIVGPNASGKSNILEAIYVLSNGRSRRVDYDKELLRNGNSVGIISGILSTNEEDRRLEIVIQGLDVETNLSKKVFRVNKVGRKMSDFVGNLMSVLFEPSDLEIVTESPSVRREYVDRMLKQVHRDYRRAFAGFSEIKRQRNKLLEAISEGKANEERLNFWDSKLVEQAFVLSRYRSSLFEYFSYNLERVSSNIFVNAAISMNYKRSPLSRERLKETRKRDIRARNTLSGPHREDFEILVDERPIKSYGSRGQQRSVVLSLKILELEYISRVTNTRPILLLDDIFSELDEKHRGMVFSLFGKQQTILTTADINLIPEDLRGNIKIIELK